MYKLSFKIAYTVILKYLKQKKIKDKIRSFILGPEIKGLELKLLKMWDCVGWRVPGLGRGPHWLSASGAATTELTQHPFRQQTFVVSEFWSLEV